MSLTEITGDLFAIPDLDALAQGVNCVGVMGKGIALRFRELWPAMFADYQAACLRGDLTPGTLHTWRGRPDGHRIYNLATQPKPGPCATLSVLDVALTAMVKHAKAHGARRIGMPRIGCGLGGLSWAAVRPVIERHARDIKIVVVERSEKARSR